MRSFHQHFNQPLSYSNPFVLLQLPVPMTEPWQNSYRYQQVVKDSNSCRMDPFPSLIDSDMVDPTRHSIGIGTSDLYPPSDPRRLSSQRDSSNPSYFQNPPYNSTEAIPGQEATSPTKRFQNHARRLEVINPPPPTNQVEGSSSAPNGRQTSNQ